MNGLYFVELGNGFYSFQLPNGILVANMVMPNDGRDSHDFDTLFNISKLISARCGLIEGDIKELKRLKLPDNIRVVKGTNNYSIYLNGNMQIAEIGLPTDIISAKVVVGISILLEKRWKSFIKRQSIYSNINSFKINNKIN